MRETLPLLLELFLLEPRFFELPFLRFAFFVGPSDDDADGVSALSIPACVDAGAAPTVPTSRYRVDNDVCADPMGRAPQLFGAELQAADRFRELGRPGKLVFEYARKRASGEGLNENVLYYPG